MGKPDQESAAAEEARRATGDAAGRGRGGLLPWQESVSYFTTLRGPHWADATHW